ncbi:uncharacterized protein METZ01_LOCUS353705 [marine metagenome]|uniref:Uncharacterized protein n=1 Tax=marine metagenome TaxID=408172 RepID=A0A382RW08_9ZZZZ|tara:strand:+ start:218 stop:340 length:123 start_codon:yes stop_codon:yes gene_type:complete
MAKESIGKVIIFSIRALIRIAAQFYEEGVDVKRIEQHVRN